MIAGVITAGLMTRMPTFGGASLPPHVLPSLSQTGHSIGAGVQKVVPGSLVGQEHSRTHGSIHGAHISSPQPLKPCRVGRRVHDSVLNIPMSQIVLNQPRVRALVGQGEAAGMAQHVRVGLNG